MKQQKRWYKKFKQNRKAMFSLMFLSVIVFLSFTAEIWSNNKPLVMYWHQQIYFPIFKSYHPSLFFQENIFHVLFPLYPFHKEFHCVHICLTHESNASS